MSYNKDYYTRALQELSVRRDRNKTLLDTRRREVELILPRYRELEKALSATAAGLIGLVAREDVTPGSFEEMRQRNLAIQQEMKNLLAQSKFGAGYLDEQYTCPHCHDTGTADGKWCECVNKLILGYISEELNAVSPLKLCDFEHFSTKYYPSTPDPKLGAVPQKVMAINLEYCKKYAESFSTRSDSILMQGSTGLGKTHLSLAIANRVIQRGFSVVYGSVPELLRTIEKEYFGKSDADTIEVLSSCELLILDDLGAEMDKPLYASFLYEVINARINRQLPFIASTNLLSSEIKNRYQDRISSRLFSCELLSFVGTDVRMILKNQ